MYDIHKVIWRIYFIEEKKKVLAGIVLASTTVEALERASKKIWAKQYNSYPEGVEFIAQI